MEEVEDHPIHVEEVEEVVIIKDLATTITETTMDITADIMETTTEDTMENIIRRALRRVDFMVNNQFNYVKDRKDYEEDKDYNEDHKHSVKSSEKSFVHNESKIQSNLSKIGHGKALKILMITEKPSIAKTIASILSNGKAKESKSDIKLLFNKN